MGSSGNVSWFADIGLNDRPNVGGKGGSLGELLRAGIAIPPGFVVRTQAFERFLEVLERESPIRAPVESLGSKVLEAITVRSKETRDRLEQAALPASIAEKISAAHAQMCDAFPFPAVSV